MSVLHSKSTRGAAKTQWPTISSNEHAVLSMYHMGGYAPFKKYKKYSDLATEYNQFKTQQGLGPSKSGARTALTQFNRTLLGT